jgi:predicted lipid-binding transport protein (Tim44 family)
MSGLDLVFLAAVAVFIAYRLYLVLGTRAGHERPPEQLPDARDRPKALSRSPNENVIPLPRAKEGPKPARAVQTARYDGPVASGIAEIQGADNNFDPEQFLDGAKMAHEMIVQAFAEGDRAALKPLLAVDVHESFAAAITDRESAGRKTEFTFVGLRSADLIQAGLRGRTAEITVKFVSEMISATRDAAGAVIDGVAGVVRDVTDIWTFARDIRSGDPNWKLVATGSA